MSDPVSHAHGSQLMLQKAGCSASQIVPAILEEPYSVNSVTQIMRSPPWVVPKPQPPMGLERWEKWSPRLLPIIPGLGWIIRQIVAAATERSFILFGGEPRNALARKKARKFHFSR